MGLRNLPEKTAEKLSSLVEIKPHQVVSMSLSRSENAEITLLAFADGEDLSDETYPRDTLYFVLEGSMNVVMQDGSVSVSTGEVLKVPAGKIHRLATENAFKIMQISL